MEDVGSRKKRRQSRDDLRLTAIVENRVFSNEKALRGYQALVRGTGERQAVPSSPKLVRLSKGKDDLALVFRGRHDLACCAIHELKGRLIVRLHKTVFLGEPGLSADE
jgi:hypothetical protein